MRFFRQARNDIFVDNIFRFIVYLSSIYFINNEKSNNIKIVGWGILIAHFYKDAVDMQQWPKWTDYIGLLMGIILIYDGCKLEEYVILIMGIIKMIAHIRQFTLNDNRYYY